MSDAQVKNCAAKAASAAFAAEVDGQRELARLEQRRASALEAALRLNPLSADDALHNARLFMAFLSGSE